MKLNNNEEKIEEYHDEKIINKINKNKFLDFNPEMFNFDYMINNEKKNILDIQNDIIFLKKKFFDKNEIYNFFINQMNEFLLNLNICYKKNEQIILNCVNYKYNISYLNY